MSSHDYEREPMLSMRKQTPFKYDLRQILQRVELDDTIKSTFIASIIAKGSRSGISEAKDYIYSMADEHEGLSEDAANAICRLLDQYTKYR